MKRKAQNSGTVKKENSGSRQNTRSDEKSATQNETKHRLLQTIQNLNAFGPDLAKEADKYDTNHFSGCVLTITDENRNKFETSNAVVASVGACPHFEFKLKRSA